MSWAAIGATVAGAALSAGVAYASQPDYGNPSKSSRKVVLAQLKALPGQRKVEAAAKLGIPVDYQTFGKKKVTIEKPIDQALKDGDITPVEYNRYAANGQKMAKVRIPQGAVQHADFTGYGDADIEGQLAKDMAQNQLELQQKYGEDFAKLAREQAALADPEGTAARGMLADKIMEMDEARKTRQRPVATMLDAQIGGDVDLGRDLDPESEAAIREVLARRGDTTSGLDGVSQYLQDGPEGDARIAGRLRRGMAYQSSGQSPEDQAYREEQQSMADMASFLGGRTPQSQFGALQAGQQGASPMPRGGALPNVQPNINQMGAQAGLQRYGQGVQAVAGNVSPWFAGLSLAAKGIATAGRGLNNG